MDGAEETPGEFPLYGDRAPLGAPTASSGGQRSGSPQAQPSGRPVCPVCGGETFEEGFVEGTSDSLVRYYAAPREDGLFGVKRFGLERRPVLARRCLGCSRLDLFAPQPD